jgi:hypothetical protein
MPTNNRTKEYLQHHRGALTFCGQKLSARTRSDEIAVQIVDAVNLQIVDNIVNTLSKGIELHTTSSLVDGKDLTLPEACKAVAKHRDPYRWIIIEKNKHCWGLFFAGGGLGLCRETLKHYKNRSNCRLSQPMKLPRWLIKLFGISLNWPTCKQEINDQTFEQKIIQVTPPIEPVQTQVNKELAIPIHQSLQQQRITIDLSEDIIKSLDELGTILGKTREESLKYLLKSVLLE